MNITQEQRQKEIDQAWAQHAKASAPAKDKDAAWRQADKELNFRQRSSV